ncbi:GDSL-type esterase/lipase family protein [Streptomyces abyssomicinicus]|uniref:GDSL-type esterase/lipase family protein n=1 Tax=Streptomyces abyssomicinicus TaxID=574929 RepID=UPI00124FE223|nr:GDSL-type esterase/lipase family protein [Streptomyces abyssomicinicus]
MRRTGFLRPQVLPFLGLLAALILSLVLAPAPHAAAAPTGKALADPVRVMPLGDSITGSPGCWRAVLWNQLRDAGYTGVDFVGTLGPQGCGQEYDGDNEGHGGELVTNTAGQNLLPARLAATRPDVVMMHFGTNDVWSNIPPDRILAAYTKLVEQMRAVDADVKVLVAQIIPMNPSTCGECAQRVVELNARIPAWAAATSTSLSPVTVVDQWTGFGTAADTYDGVHPNASGDAKIAARWYPALASLLDAGVPGEPGEPGEPGDGEAVCTATFRAVSSWQGGYQAEVTVTNTSSSALSGWTVTVAPAGGGRVTQVWNGSLTTSAGTARVTNAAWNGTLAPGASAGFGAIVTGSGTGGSPSAAVGCTARAAS